jgi:hypothetical protein
MWGKRKEDRKRPEKVGLDALHIHMKATGRGSDDLIWEHDLTPKSICSNCCEQKSLKTLIQVVPRTDH